MKLESPMKPHVRRMKDGELTALLGGSVVMFTAARPRDSSPNTSASPSNLSSQLEDQPQVDLSRLPSSQDSTPR